VGVIAAAPGAQVGVDVERHRDEDAEQAWGEGWLAEPERLALERLPRAERLRAVTRCWTQKEAVLKGRGVGLHVAPETVRTPVSAHGTCGEWSLHPVPVPAEFVASLAVRSPDPVTETRVHRLLPGGMR
jgi:4'-phosphopantetheinyl transferase